MHNHSSDTRAALARLRIFLDIDGVLNNWGAWLADNYKNENTYNLISPDNLANFIHLAVNTDAEVWIHSSWRRRMREDQIVACFNKIIPHHYSFMKGCVPRWKMSSEHCHDVWAFMEDMGFVDKKVVILDDNPSRFKFSPCEPYVYLTDSRTGLNLIDLENIGNLLKEKYNINYDPPVVYL